MEEIKLQQKLLILVILSVLCLTAPALADAAVPDNTAVNITTTNVIDSDPVVQAGDMAEDQSSTTIELPRQNGLNLTVVNKQRPSLYDSEYPGTYYFNIGNNMTNGGQNAVHISDSYQTAAGTITSSNSSTGTFYITDTGGKGYEDEAILLIAVQETDSSPAFSIDLTVEGYKFADHAVSSAPTLDEVGAFNSNAYATTLGASSFLTYDGQTVSQAWKPSTASTGDVNMKLFYGQNLDGPKYNFILVDLNTSVVGRNAAYQTQLTNYGSPKVTYTIHGYSGGNVSFVPYTWINYTTGGGSYFDRTIGWTSRADSTADGTSSWLVTLPATETGTAPVTNFSATPTSGEAPLNVTFTDLSTGSPTSWAWDFDNDGVLDSIEQNPTYTYPVSGTYTVNLTVTSPAGTSSALKADYINVTGSRNWTVGATGCDFTTITDAINNPLMQAGDTVFVYNGTYDTGSTSASQSVQFTLKGESADAVTWSRTGAVSLNGAGTVVEGITFAVPAGGYNQRISLSGSDSVLRNCIFDGGGGSLVRVSASGVSVENNTFRNTWLGQYSAALELRSTSDCSVASNTFSNISNGYSLIVYKATSNTIENNTFTSVRWGIRLNQKTTTDNYIIGNTFTGCSASGGGVAFSSAGPDNTVYLNNFIGNGKDISYAGTPPAGTSYISPDPITYTYQGTTYSAQLGNYWDTYSGSDADGDGIGASSHPLRTKEPFDADTAPLIDRTQFFFGADHSAVASVRIIPDVAQFGVNDTAQFTAKAIDTDGLNVPSLTYTWSSSNETVGTVNQTGFFTAHAFGETTLTASTGGISNTSTVNVLPPPTVDFTAAPLTGMAPLKVQFNDTSANLPTSWLWDFGDGDSTNATEQNPVHTYAVVGTYTVNLTSTNAAGTSSTVKTGYINVTAQAPPGASFNASVTFGRTPLTVTFTDTSTGYNITGWYWDFGDGTNATEQNPVHTFTVAGNYTVMLTATNDGGSNATSLRIEGSDRYSPRIFFSANKTQGKFPLTVQFADESTDSPHGWYWDFGDGTNSTEQNPVHTFAEIGEYNVSLTATNVYGSNTTTETSYIIVRDTAAVPIPRNRNINLYVANDEGVKYDEPNGVTRYGDIGIPYNYVPNTYFFMFGSAGGGTNPMDISNNPNEMRGQVTRTNNQSGTFWVTFHGGQEYMHEGILMLAVNGTIPDDFKVHIKSSGYSFTPPKPAVGNNNTISNLTYVEGAVDQTFTKDDFIYGPQIWRPFGLANNPIYCGQNMSDTDNTFQLMFIDLDVGAMKTGTDNGAIKVEYELSNLTSFAAFDSYGWYRVSNHGTGVIMLNYGSDYGVIGDGTSRPFAPGANFTATPTSGEAPLNVTFTDLSTDSPTSWAWDFDNDGVVDSTEQNPTHTYTAAGTYTVNLTVSNAAGTDSEVKTDYITVTGGGSSGDAPVANFTADVTSGNVPLTVQFTDTSINATAWSGSFGDGSTSTEQNPTHTYTSIGRYTVSLTASNTDGSDTMTHYRSISVRDMPSEPPRNKTGYTLHDGGTNVTTVDGKQQVSFNATAGDGTVSGNDIHLSTGTLNVTIETSGLTMNGTVSTGSITGVRLESSQPVTAALGTAGNVSIAFNASMNVYTPDLNITTSIYDRPSDEASNAFTLLAAAKDLSITSTAYTVYFTKTNLGANDTIEDAYLRMTVSPAWVEANGGADAIKVFRQDDDGITTVLKTTYLGLDADGMMVFEAYSPDGFSTFMIAATESTATMTTTSISSGSSGGGSSSLGAAAAGNIKAGETATLVLDETAITGIEVHAQENISEILITTEAGKEPEGAVAPDGTVYQYIEVKGYKVSEGSLKSATIRFSVPKTWVDEKLSSPDTVSLYHYNEETDAWDLLSTVYGSEENGYYTYYADSASLGYFAIVGTPNETEGTVSSGNPAGENQGSDVQQQEPVTSTTTTVPATTATTSPLFDGGMIICVAFGIICVLGLFGRRKQ